MMAVIVGAHGVSGYSSQMVVMCDRVVKRGGSLVQSEGRGRQGLCEGVGCAAPSGGWDGSGSKRIKINK